MHIAFLTLFLGLISGRVPVELTATGPGPSMPAISAISAIELTLDGTPAGRIAGPPFKGHVDFGPALLPHHLMARGVDAQGVEVARTEQWVNLPRPPAEVEAVPEPGPDGRTAAVRLAFQSLTRERPAKVTAAFDGSPLPVAGSRVALPSYAADTGHLLTIEVSYPSGLTARRDLAFGFGGEVSTELTALPLRRRGLLHGKLPERPAGFAGWFLESRQALRTVAVEEGPAELLVVRAPGAPPLLRAIGAIGLRSLHSAVGGLQDIRQLRTSFSLGPADRMRFLHPTAQRFAGSGLSSDLFPSSQDFTAADGGLFWLLTGVVQETGPSARLADAVAVAGIQALTTNRRRAVLLVLDGTTEDTSRYDPATVRRYLAAIHVPLYVWSVRQPPYSPGTTAWGRIEDASVLVHLQQAFGRLADDLADQRIVWLDGRHLPQGIRLSAQAAKTTGLAGLAAIAEP
jgi:hypothetical protein